MIFLNQLCFVYGVKLAHASTVALLLGTTPIFIGLISLALRLERLPAPVLDRRRDHVRRRRADRASANGSVGSSLWGTLLAIATALTWACYTVSIAPLMRRYSPYRISALVLAIGWVPLALVSFPQVAEQQFSFGWKVWLGFGYAVVGPLFLTNILWFTAIDRVGASRASLFANLQPFFAVVFALLLLSESLERAGDRRRRAHLRRDRARAVLAPAASGCGGRTRRCARGRRPRSGWALATSPRRASRR